MHEWSDCYDNHITELQHVNHALACAMFMLNNIDSWVSKLVSIPRWQPPPPLPLQKHMTHTHIHPPTQSYKPLWHIRIPTSWNS